MSAENENTEKSNPPTKNVRAFKRSVQHLIFIMSEQGVPLTLEDLVRHRAVHYFSGCTGRNWDFRFLREQAEVIVPMAGTVAVNDTEGCIQCGLQGLGLIELAEYLVSPCSNQATWSKCL